MATPMVALFNHKGGVGKTTITVNLARALAQSGQRVLVVDGDPQCNTTAFYLPEEDVDQLLEESQEVDKGSTIWSAISKAARGKGDVRPISPTLVDDAGVWLMPGDVALGSFEDRLVGAWKDCFSRDPASVDLVSALNRAIRATADEIHADIILLDVGPSIGGLNRVLLLSCDHFVVPVGCDLYSLRALRTVGESMVTWMNDCNTIAGLVSGLEVRTLTGRPQFIGYLTQHFNIYRSRATAPFEEWERRIAPRISRDIVAVLDAAERFRTASAKLGSIPAFHSLAPLSQKLGLPIGALAGADGVNSGYGPKIQEADRLFRRIAQEIQARVA